VVKNIEAKLIQPSDPAVPAGTDAVFVCDPLHHVADRPSWLAKLAAGMKAGAQVVLIEFKEVNLPEGPPEAAILRRTCVRRQHSRPRTLHQGARRSRTLEEVVPMLGHS